MQRCLPVDREVKARYGQRRGQAGLAEDEGEGPGEQDGDNRKNRAATSVDRPD